MEDQQKHRVQMEVQKKERYAEAVKETIEKNIKIKQFEEKIKMDKLRLQNEYKSILDRQLNNKPMSNEVEIREQGRVTNAINTMEKASNCMIPGIYNIASIGSKPIYRTGVMITQAYNSPQRTLEAHYADVYSKYNPISNPVPLITSNPYIIKEMMKHSKT